MVNPYKRSIKFQVIIHSHITAMIAAKVVTAIATVITLSTLAKIIHGLVSNRKKEEPGLELSDIEAEEATQEDEYGMFRRFLKGKVRNLVDRHAILQTTMVELARVLRLEDCVIWMPKEYNQPDLLQIAHSLKLRQSDYSPDLPVISSTDETVQMVLKEIGAISIPVESELARYSFAGTWRPDAVEIDYVFAVRIPLLNISSFRRELIPHNVSTLFAVIVLVLPKQEKLKWGKHETAIVEAAVDQVIIALSHATDMEETLKPREDLKQQSTGALSSLHVQSNLNEVHKYIEGIMQRSNKVISNLMDEIFKFSRLEFDRLSLNSVRFLLPELIRVAEILLEPTATSKGLGLTFKAHENLPSWIVVGDEIRIFQILLNSVGNAIKFTEKGTVRVDISIEQINDEVYSESRIDKLTSCANIHFVVKGMSGGKNPTAKRQLFNQSDEVQSAIAGSGLGWPISREFIELMKGKIWIESDGDCAEYSRTCHFSLPVEIVHNYEHEPSLTDTDYELYTVQADGYPVSGMEGYGNEVAVLHSGKPPSEGPSYDSPPGLRPANYQTPNAEIPINTMSPESITNTGQHSLLISASAPSPVTTPVHVLPRSPKPTRLHTSCQRSLF